MLDVITGIKDLTSGKGRSRTMTKQNS